MRVIAAVTVAFLLAVGCGRPAAGPAPSESFDVPPLPNASGATSSAPPPTSTTANRCIVPLAATPPPIPPPASDKACPPEPDTQLLPLAEISFLDASPALTIHAEIADRPDSIERGLMYRRAMPDDAGMFFKLDDRRIHTFWMHNTCIPLDMLFVDSDGLIVGIAEAAAPLTDAIRSVRCVSAYVLEVNGGWSRKHKVTPGQRITIPS